MYKPLYTNAHRYCSARIPKSPQRHHHGTIQYAYLHCGQCWSAGWPDHCPHLESARNGQKRTSKHRDPLPPHSPSRESNYKFTILSVVQSVLNLTGRTGGEVEWVGVGSSALLPPSPSSLLLAVLGGVSSSPCGGWVVSNSLSGNPVPLASAPDPIPGWGC